MFELEFVESICFSVLYWLLLLFSIKRDDDGVIKFELSVLPDTVLFVDDAVDDDVNDEDKQLNTVCPFLETSLPPFDSFNCFLILK